MCTEGPWLDESDRGVGIGAATQSELYPSPFAAVKDHADQVRADLTTDSPGSGDGRHARHVAIGLGGIAGGEAKACEGSVLRER